MRKQTNHSTDSQYEKSNAGVGVRVYLDNAAATACDPRVVAAMQPYWSSEPANPNALHKEGVEAARALDSACTTVARVLKAQSSEITFTSGGTEANTLAMMGLVNALLADGRKAKDTHVITGGVEHSSIQGCVSVLKGLGVQTSVLSVDSAGRVDCKQLKEELRPETVLVSVMYANNEVGTVERIEEVAHIVRNFRKENSTVYPLLHTDACQAPAWLPVYVLKLGVDLLSLDGQKVFGPKGVGCLYHKGGVQLAPMLCSLSGSVRPGTPPVPLIVGFAKALELVEEERESYVTTISSLRDKLIADVQAQISDAVLNGPKGDERLANNVSFSFPGLDGEQLVLELDARGLAVSTRSACLKDDVAGSFVVRALGGDESVATSVVRLSLSRYTTMKEIEQATRTLLQVVGWLRKTAGIDKPNML